MNSIGGCYSDVKDVKALLIMYQNVQFIGMNFSVTGWVIGKVFHVKMNILQNLRRKSCRLGIEMK